MQTFTSASTSTNRSKLPRVYTRARFSSCFILDYGCGKYTDHIRDHLGQQKRVLLPFDPFNQPGRVNLVTMKLIDVCKRERFPVDCVCSNVLNVIDSDGEVSRICYQLEQLVTTTGGTLFVTVYDGDRSGVGRQTGRDQYQRNEPLREYLRFFHNATVRNGMIIVNGGNNNETY